MIVMGTVTGRRYEGPLQVAFEAAQPRALLAAAKDFQREVQYALRPGYRSSLGNQGQFVTGASVEHVAIIPPAYSMGRWAVSVGTDLAYNLFWEVGHHNLFTRHFERDEKWHPAFVRVRPTARATYMRIVQTAMRAASGGDV